MNLTLHIVRTDLLRMRGWIACWIGVLLLPIVFGLRLLAEHPFGEEEWNLPNALGVLAGLQALVGYLLTIGLVHEHGIVGTKQFWLTRPISRGRLLRAKALGAFVIVGVLPILVSLPWWLWCGFGPAHIMRAVGDTMVVMALVILPAAVMAVLTDSLARALLWTVMLVAVGVFTILHFAIVNTAIARDAAEGSLLVSRSVVAVVAVGLVLAAVVALQFHLRRRGWWLAAAGALLVVMVLAASRWPWPWIPEIPRQHHVARAGGMNARFESAVAEPIERVPSWIPASERSQRVNINLGATQVPAEWDLFGMLARHRWTWSDGTSISREGDLHPRWEGEWHHPDAETQRWLERENPDRGGRTARGRGELRVELPVWLRPSMVARMDSDTPAYEVNTWWQLIRNEQEMEIPLQPGGWTKEGGLALRIHEVHRRPQELTVVVVATRPALIRTLLRELSDKLSPYYHFRVYGAGVVFTTRDKNGRAIDSFVAYSGYADDPRTTVVNGVEIRWRSRLMAAPQVVRNGKWVVDPEWRGEGTLSVTTRHDDGVFVRDVREPKFSLTGKK